MAELSPYVHQQAFHLGLAAPSARLYTYVSGTDTPQPVFLDAALAVPATNPLVADITGKFAPFWLAAVAYRFTMTDAAGVTIEGPTDGISNVVSVAGDVLTAGALSLTTGQITFPAVPVPSTNPNTLDWYDERDFTPILVSSGGSSGQTYTHQLGRSVKHGKNVQCWIHVALATVGTFSAGEVHIENLPFIAESGPMLTQLGGTIFWGGLGANFVTIVPIVFAGTTSMRLYGTTAAASSLVAVPASVPADRLAVSGACVVHGCVMSGSPHGRVSTAKENQDSTAQQAPSRRRPHAWRTEPCPDVPSGGGGTGRT